jgi:hypothetical protein
MSDMLVSKLICLANSRDFFETKFLFWLEALSLTGNMRLALPMLLSLNIWLASGEGVSLNISSVRQQTTNDNNYR